MKAIMITFDSLNKRYLSPYGCDWVKTPNFERLASHTVKFNKSFVGSLPCMPARREMHTGRLNFLHRSWGPIEPFDDSMPEILKNNGIYSHLTTDHYHYWEDGGCTYHTRYSSAELNRGQESDRWKGFAGKVELPEHLGQVKEADQINRPYMACEEHQPQTLTFSQGVEFLDQNCEEDNWFLHVETFDPHEPFYTMPHYQKLYDPDYAGPHFDWPVYGPVSEEEEPYIEHMRRMYAALVTMCDVNLGKILDRMDAYNMWEDTLLIVNTDHGFLLGEHDWWSKTPQGALYNEVSNTPLFIYDPIHKKAGTSDALVQTIDLAPTILDHFNLPIPKDMLGKSLLPTIRTGEKVRDTALYGMHGMQIACTDGRYTYFLAPGEVNAPLYNYTLMPTHMTCMYPVEEFEGVTLREPFSFTKGCKTMKTRNYDHYFRREADTSHNFETLLFDTQTDPGQMHPLEDADKSKWFKEQIRVHLKENDAPEEQYQRMQL